MIETTSDAVPKPRGGKAAATMVAAGILLSRFSGLIQFRLFAHYLGTSVAADAYRAAFRVPNMLQNLLGEGVLSASFIPVYARLRAEGRQREASELAEAVFALLALLASIIVALGIVCAPLLVTVLAPGFHGEKRDLTIAFIRIVFPGTGLLVFAAWCLGVLNSHGRFFLSYASAVMMNLAIIATLLWQGGLRGHGPISLAYAISWAAVAGAVLQFAVQAPTVYSLLRPLSGHLQLRSVHVAAVIAAFIPVFISRGVFQISGFIDLQLASFLPSGNVLLNYAQTLYMLPVSLFGMSVSAAELPAMSSAIGTDSEIASTLRSRLSSGLEKISFFVVPSAVAFLALGNVVASTLYRTGKFTDQDVMFVWAALAGSGVGLLAQTMGRLYSSTFYALRDTRTPLRYALMRVALTLCLGYLFALPLPRALGIDRNWGVAGLTSSAGIAGWVEFALLRRGIQARIGHVEFSTSRVLKLWTAALIAAAFALLVEWSLHMGSPVLRGLIILIPYGIIYLAITQMMGLNATLSSALTRFRGKRS
ncbi:MAG TPA: murein biosynthesis integral membrane protein MurJ [Candidatus Saccharimonadales bacterium]|nr:murein biosynthesis integral membrane protein MurJ [Candidatus Saccharimonadales bacterium]